MKIKPVIFGCLAIAVLSFKAADSILTELNLSGSTVKWYIQHNLAGSFTSNANPEEPGNNSGNTPMSVEEQLSHFRLPTLRELSALKTGDKTGAASRLCNYVKDYVSSAAFRADYAKERDAAKPTDEPYRPDAATIQAQKETVKTMEDMILIYKNMEGMPANLVPDMFKSIEQMKKDIVAMEDPTPNKTKWLKMYPENPETMVKTRLEEYLSLVATVDFDAKLTGTGKQQKFVNPTYESKSLKWKAIYRAGKEVNSVVTAFVKDWLKAGVHIAQ